MQNFEFLAFFVLAQRAKIDENWTQNRDFKFSKNHSSVIFQHINLKFEIQVDYDLSFRCYAISLNRSKIAINVKNV